MNQYSIDFQKTYTLVYVYNYDADKTYLNYFTGAEIYKAYKSLPNRVCASHDLRNRLKEKIEIAGRLELKLPLLKERHRKDTIQYVDCAHRKGCWTCQKTLREDYAAYMALSLGEIKKQRWQVKELIGDTDQEVLFVFDEGSLHETHSLETLFKS